MLHFCNALLVIYEADHHLDNIETVLDISQIPNVANPLLVCIVAFFGLYFQSLWTLRLSLLSLMAVESGVIIAEDDGVICAIMVLCGYY